MDTVSAPTSDLAAYAQAAKHVACAIDVLRRRRVADEGADVGVINAAEEHLRGALGTTQRLGLFDLCGMEFDEWKPDARQTFRYEIQPPGTSESFGFDGYGDGDTFTFKELELSSSRLPWFPTAELAVFALCVTEGIPLGGRLTIADARSAAAG